jgi:hypothetical protein
MGFIRWIDRNLWSVPVMVFMATWAGFGLWSMASTKPVLLAAAQPAARQAVYSSLTGSASAFFAAALAVVAILLVFPRLTTTGIEQSLALARTRTVGVLLMSSWFVAMVVIVATIALAVDSKPTGNSVLTTVIEASGCASVIGLLAGGFGLALIIVERSRR